MSVIAIVAPMQTMQRKVEKKKKRSSQCINIRRVSCWCTRANSNNSIRRIQVDRFIDDDWRLITARWIFMHLFICAMGECGGVQLPRRIHYDIQVICITWISEYRIGAQFSPGLFCYLLFSRFFWVLSVPNGMNGKEN